MPTVPREPSTLTHSVKTVVDGLKPLGKDYQFLIVKNNTEHPEAVSVAEEYGLTLLDGTSPHPALDPALNLNRKRVWERKLVLDMARSLEMAADSGAEQILYLEDDIEGAPTLHKTLYTRTWLTTLFSGLCGINNWHHPNTCSTQALLYRNDENIRTLIQFLRDNCDKKSADALVYIFVSQQRLTMSQRIPNPIQHTGFHSSRDSERFELLSPTYRNGKPVPPPLAVVWAARYLATRFKIWLETR